MRITKRNVSKPFASLIAQSEPGKRAAIVRQVGRSYRVPEKAVHDYLRDAYIEAG